MFPVRWAVGDSLLERPDPAKPDRTILGLRIGSVRLREDLADANTRLSAILDTIDDAFVSVDASWRYTVVNERAAKMLGHPADFLIGKRMDDLFPDAAGWPHSRTVMEQRGRGRGSRPAKARRARSHRPSSCASLITARYAAPRRGHLVPVVDFAPGARDAGLDRQGADMLIPQESFNNQSVLDIYKAAYVEASMQDDGEIKADMAGVKVFANVDQARSLFTVRALFAARPGSARTDILEFCNGVNLALIMIRAYVTAETNVIVFDHTTDTKGGVTGEEVIDVTRRFADLIRGACALDAKNVVA